MLLAVSAALAAPAPALEAKVGGKPFVPPAVLAGPEPTKPGMMWVVLSDLPMTCAELLSKTPKTGAKPVMIAFLATKAGTVSREIYGLSATVDGATATLTSMPDAVGGKGTVTLAVDGKKDRLRGDVQFELCELVPDKPTLTAELAPTELALSEPSMFPDQPPAELKVRMALPVGWTEVPADKYVPYRRWTAPDGFTTLSISLQSPATDFATEAAEWSKMQLGAFDPPYEVESKAEGPVGAGAYALHWTHRNGKEGPWIHNLDVFRQDAGWPHQVHCNLASDEAGAAVLVEPVRAACAALERLP